MSSDFAIRVANLSKCYHIYENPRDRLKQFLLPKIRRLLRLRSKNYYREFWALKDASFDVERGETVGIVGRNGSGKSTLLQMISGTLTPTSGSIETTGRVAALLELGAGFNPEFTGRENVYMNASILGMGRKEIDEIFEEIAAFADIGEFIDQPVKTYSSGMFARIAFSTAIHVMPNILIIDEILAVGDTVFQKKCIDKISTIRKTGCSILLVSHDPYQIRSICKRAILIEHGNVVRFGDSQEIMDIYSNILADAEIKKISDGGLSDEKNKSFRVMIDRVALLNANGDEVDCVASGETVVISFEYSIINPEILNGVTFVVNLYSKDGIYIFGTTTLMGGQKPFLAKEKGLVRVRFPKLNLLSGTYNWRVAVNGDDELGALAEAVPVCEFKVRDNFRAVGLIELPHVWEIEG